MWREERGEMIDKFLAKHIGGRKEMHKYKDKHMGKNI